jgi:hypothetical protein
MLVAIPVPGLLGLELVLLPRGWPRELLFRTHKKNSTKKKINSGKWLVR